MRQIAYRCIGLTDDVSDDYVRELTGDCLNFEELFEIIDVTKLTPLNFR
jgi:hypothetical protein